MAVITEKFPRCPESGPRGISGGLPMSIKGDRGRVDAAGLLVSRVLAGDRRHRSQFENGNRDRR